MAGPLSSAGIRIFSPRFQQLLLYEEIQLHFNKFLKVVLK